MAERSKSKASTRPGPPAAPEGASDRSELRLVDLARGILSKEIRPRIADIRRLAEAVVSGGDVKPSKADGEGKKSKARPDEKGGKKKKKKLAKIPGQRAKK